ncbi:glycoside hydrolase family 15 protein [Saccharolobus solfataricus]|nr:glycoside hydrolase family 15 protein [Saccharolobus solfataricus]AKA74992.1 glycoside hydrolase family 15 protein [Saccharolobus solfataricus]AKA77685.1 glycoside hydrolase family 15 protein [Saccharolobus solfataricus]AKA80376.1 glycoside hydrolase family 15 protein [Saccharolobus solfataricus]AZF69455.1 glycoside hydrolase family 15 protein [Saccharolobus solfataricus]AZF72075.1 glycoside hydrolase family 15 protein [Saccharolobus solfataricus]
MTRYLILGNGSLTVLYDNNFTVREIYWPLTTTNNLHRGRFGVFVNGKFSWLDNLNPKIGYSDDTLAVYSSFSFEGIDFNLEDVIDMAYDIWIRKVSAKNVEDKDVRVFTAFDFHVGGTPDGNTALFDPYSESMIQYKGSRWFLLSSSIPFYQYATGIKEYKGLLGTWKDCEDGELSGNPIAQGSVDFASSFKLYGEDFYIWLVAGKNYNEVRGLNDYVRKRTPQILFKRVKDYWRAWLSKVSDYGEYNSILKRSLLILQSHIQNNGAIVASLDTDIMKFNRDTYNYVWHRDAVFCILALELMGYFDRSRQFFEFTRRLFTINGALFHKYTVDGHFGSTWHPWTLDYLPIQEDETALVLYALWFHFSRWKDVDFIKTYYRPMVKGIADFLVNYREKVTGLPLLSFDLWEERIGIHFYTTITVIAGLRAAANFARYFGEDDLAQKYESVADQMRSALDLFWVSDHYARTIYIRESQVYKIDKTVDSSTLLAPIFNVIPIDNSRFVKNLETVVETLGIRGGLARYEGDQYLRGGNNPNIWFISTLWLSEVYSLIGDKEKAKEKIDWVLSKSLSTGVIPEQIDENNNYPSVSPLAWSHAELIRAIYALRNNILDQR